MNKYISLICGLIGFAFGWFVTSSGYKAKIADIEKMNAKAVETLVEKHNEKLENEGRALARAISERDSEMDRVRRLELSLARTTQRLRDAQRSSGLSSTNSDTRKSSERSDGGCGEILVRLSESGAVCCSLLGRLNADRNAVRKMQ